VTEWLMCLAPGVSGARVLVVEPYMYGRKPAAVVFDVLVALSEASGQCFCTSGSAEARSQCVSRAHSTISVRSQ
jgi:hypothetical protein